MVGWSSLTSCCLRGDDSFVTRCCPTMAAFSSGAKYSPVAEYHGTPLASPLADFLRRFFVDDFWANSSGVPANTNCPPSTPAPGPRSMIQSAHLITSKLCSMTTTVFPTSTSRCGRSCCWQNCERDACYRQLGRSLHRRRGCTQHWALHIVPRRRNGRSVW